MGRIYAVVFDRTNSVRETIERSKLSSTKRLVSIYRSLVYSITVLIVLISAVVVSVIVYIRTGRSIGDISDITSSTTALVAIVTTVYALATILLMAAGEKGGFRSFLMSVSKFIALLVGTSEYSQVMSKPERPAETGEAIEKSPHSIALSSSISPAARRRITERNIKLWRSQALQSNHNLIFDNIFCNFFKAFVKQPLEWFQTLQSPPPGSGPGSFRSC